MISLPRDVPYVCECCGRLNIADGHNTRVGPYTVPAIRLDKPTVVRFTSGAHGRKEAGKYAFWVACGAGRDGTWNVIGRARVKLSPGDRFDRMWKEQRNAKKRSVRRAYARMVRMMKDINYIRPASKNEVERWIATHQKDSAFIRGPHIIGGRPIKHLRNLP